MIFAQTATHHSVLVLVSGLGEDLAQYAWETSRTKTTFRRLREQVQPCRVQITEP